MHLQPREICTFLTVLTFVKYMVWGGVEKDTPNENLFNSTEKYGAISLYSNLSQELDSAFQELMTNDIQYPHKI